MKKQDKNKQEDSKLTSAISLLAVGDLFTARDIQKAFDTLVDYSLDLNFFNLFKREKS